MVLDEAGNSAGAEREYRSMIAEAERIMPGSTRQDGAEALASTVTAQVALCVAGVASD